MNEYLFALLANSITETLEKDKTKCLTKEEKKHLFTITGMIAYAACKDIEEGARIAEKEGTTITTLIETGVLT